MVDDNRRYESDDFYEDENSDYINYEVDTSDYPDEEDEDENALWDDEDTADTDIYFYHKRPLL